MPTNIYPTAFRYYLNCKGSYPQEDNEKPEYKELVKLGYATTKQNRGQTYNYTSYQLTPEGIEARDKFREQEADRLIKNLDSELLGEIMEFDYADSERHTVNLDEDQCGLLEQLLEVDLVEEHWEESWNDAWIYFQLTQFGKVVWSKLQE